MSVIQVQAAHGKAVELPAGRKLRLSTPEGHQAADFFAFSKDMSEWLSPIHTWVRTNCVKPRQGDLLVSQLRRPMLAFVRDGARGCHDMHIAACDARRYQEFGVDAYHRNCEDNMREALAEVGKEPLVTPQPINFFTNTWIDETQQLRLGDPQVNPITPGSFVVLEAMRDLICVVSSCPHDIPIPEWSLSTDPPTELHIELVGQGDPERSA